MPQGVSSHLDLFALVLLLLRTLMHLLQFQIVDLIGVVSGLVLMLHLGWVYGPTWSFLVRRQFFWCLSSHCWCRYWVRLGPSLGIEYRVDAEGYSEWNQWYTDWEVVSLCSCREEWDWEVEQLMQLFWFPVQKSQLYENSDLRSK